MKMKFYISLVLLLFGTQTVFAQKKIVVEKIRCLSIMGPVMSYLKEDDVRKNIASQLNQTLLKYQLLPVSDTTSLTIDFLEDGKDLQFVKPDFTDKDTNNLHLYLDIFEIDPKGFFKHSENVSSDTDLIKRARSVFSLESWILTAGKKVIFHEGLSLVITPAETPAIATFYRSAIRFGDLPVSIKGFAEVIKAGTNILFDPKNEMALIELKAAPVYLADNYILPKTINRPRIYVSNKKNISTYPYTGGSEMIRNGEPVYEEIFLKGKKPKTYPDDITTVIKNTAHYLTSDFVFLKQEWRDVARDKNYLLQLTTQVDPENQPEMGLAFAFTNFLKGSFHYLLLEKDTLAKFSIERAVMDNKNKIFTDIISNGYDSSSFYRINTTTKAVPVIYDYIATGKIGDHDFEIKCSGFRNTIKEIFYDKKLVCIVQGKYRPEKFVIFDASLTPELLNRLFMIGFNRFFE